MALGKKYFITCVYNSNLPAHMKQNDNAIETTFL